MYEKLLITNDDRNPIPPRNATIRSLPTRMLLKRIGLYGSLIAIAVLIGEMQPFGTEHPLYGVSAILGIASLLFVWPASVECLRRGWLWWRTRHYRAPGGRGSSDRAQLQLSDAILSVIVLIGIVALAPTLYQFIGMVRAEADPFSSLLLGLAVPLLLLALILSMGVSAQGGG